MLKTGYNAQRIKKNAKKTLNNITSLSIVNDGETACEVTIQGVTRKLPAKDDAKHLQFSFDIPGDGSYSDFEIEINFETGSGNAILDYRQVIINQCNNS